MIIAPFQGIKESQKLTGNQDESETIARGEPNCLNLPSTDGEDGVIEFSDEEKFESESRIIKESDIGQKSKSASGSDSALHKGTYKECGKFPKSPALLAQHTHDHTAEVSTLLPSQGWRASRHYCEVLVKWSGDMNCKVVR